MYVYQLRDCTYLGMRQIYWCIMKGGTGLPCLQTAKVTLVSAPSSLYLGTHFCHFSLLGFVLKFGISPS